MERIEKMMSEHPWSSLKTITEFDAGNDTPYVDIESINRLQTATHNELVHNKNIKFVKTNASTPISLLVESLVQQLCTFLESDNIKATKLYNVICEKLFDMKLIDESFSMEEFDVMRSQYQKAFYQLVDIVRDTEFSTQIQPQLISQDIHSGWSRYKREFVELEFIDSGGFGSVFKSKNRLDGSEYAIKKIILRSGNIKSVTSHLNEVKTFASLNHPNIVQYKAAWLEPFICNETEKIEKIISSETNSNSSKCTSYDTNSNLIKTFAKSEVFSENSSSEFCIQFHSSTCEFVNSNVTIEENNTKSLLSNKQNQISLSEDNKICKKFCDETDNIVCKKSRTQWATLYIQMALCKLNLKQWLQIRNERECQKSEIKAIPNQSRMNMVRNIFSQILKGIKYIHSKGIVHHDIKPSNIFITVEDEINVQLGDFGLACPLKQRHHNVPGGTQMYAAPEQLEGQCDVKNDMYSLGIVLLELVESFTTDMERIQQITELRHGRLPAHVSAEYPNLAHVIGQLIIKNPKLRPDADEVLSLLTVNYDLRIKMLQQTILNKDIEIAQLKNKLKSMGVHEYE